MVCAVDEKTQAGKKKFVFLFCFFFVNKAYVSILSHVIHRNINVNLKYKTKITFIYYEMLFTY